MRDFYVLLGVGAVLIGAVAIAQYNRHVQEVAKAEIIAKRMAEQAAKQAELARPLTQEQQEEKRHAGPRKCPQTIKKGSAFLLNP